MKKNRQFLILFIPFLFLFLGTISVSAQTIGSREIDSLVEKTLKTFDVPGSAVAIVKDDKVIHAKGYGVRSLNTKQKVDADAFVMFYLDNTGKASGIKMKAISPLTDFSYDFQDLDFVRKENVTKVSF